MAVQGPSNPLSFWKEISQDPASGVRLVHHKLHLSLPPYYLSDIKKSVKSVIDSRLTRYEPELGGVLAGYGKISILKSQGETLFNLSDVHVDVEGDFYVFSLEVGKQLTGVVNRKSHDCLGCLVHGLFYISLPKPYSVNVEDWLGRSAKLTDEVKFTVVKIDLHSQVLHIEGNIVKVIPTSKPEETSLLVERSSSDSGVSVASEDHLQADGDAEESVDDKMEKKRSKLSLTQRKKEAQMSSAAKSNPKQSTSPSKVNRSRQISDSEESVSSSQEAGESMRLELSEDTANASVKSSDSDEEIRSPKSNAMKKQGPVSPQKNAMRPSVLDSSSDSGADDTKAPTVLVKPRSASASQKAKNTPKSGQKAAKVKVATPSNVSPSKLLKKRKRGDDSIVQESPKAKKAKANPIPDEDDAQSVDDLVSNLFAAMSKKTTSQLQSEAESTPKNKKGKKVTNTQEKQDSNQPSTPKSVKKGSSPKKAPGSSKKVEPGLDATILDIVNKCLLEKSMASESMEIDEEAPAASVSAPNTPSGRKEKKKAKATEQKMLQSPPFTPKMKESPSNKKKANQVESKQDVDTDEGVDVSETPVTKAKKIKAEKTSTPVPKSAKKAVETQTPSTQMPASMKPLEGITPIKNTPATKSSTKKNIVPIDQTTPKTKPEKKSKSTDDDAESIIRELLQSSIRGSPVASPKRKMSSTPAQPKDDATRKIQTSTKKKPEADTTNNKRLSLQPKKGKQLKMEDDQDPHEKTIMKILQSVQPKEKTKVKASKK